MACTDEEHVSPTTRRRPMLDRTVANQLTTGGHAVSVDDSELQRKRSGVSNLDVRNAKSARVFEDGNSDAHFGSGGSQERSADGKLDTREDSSEGDGDGDGQKVPNKRAKVGDGKWAYVLSMILFYVQGLY